MTIIKKVIKSIGIFAITSCFVFIAYLINLIAIYSNFKMRVIGFDDNGYPNILLIIFLVFGSLYYGFTMKKPLLKNGKF
jgi:hypothetical protein